MRIKTLPNHPLTRAAFRGGPLPPQVGSCPLDFCIVNTSYTPSPAMFWKLSLPPHACVQHCRLQTLPLLPHNSELLLPLSSPSLSPSSLLPLSLSHSLFLCLSLSPSLSLPPFPPSLSLPPSPPPSLSPSLPLSLPPSLPLSLPPSPPPSLSPPSLLSSFH